MSKDLDETFDFTKRFQDEETQEDAEPFGSRIHSESRLLDGIPRQLLNVLRPFFEEKSFEKDDHLIRQGESGDCLYVVVSGKVKIYSENEFGEENVIDRSGPGDVLGEMALLTGESRSANVVAEEPVKVLALDAKTVHSLTEEHLELSKLMSNIVARRLGSVEYDALSGKTLGDYKLKRRLGKGGMAVVYEAAAEKDGRRVALKMMSHRLIYDPRARRKFDQEFELVRSFNSPFIVRTHSRFEAFQTYFLVMEFCDGKSLSEVFQEGPVNESRVRTIYEALRNALNYAHQKGVIHRDIKPGNIMELSSGEVKIMDFGLASPIDEVDQLKGISGTARYLAPELLNYHSASVETDYFAAGMTLIELIMGRKIISGRSFRMIVEQLRDWKSPDVASLCPHISQELALKVACLLSPNPEQRDWSALTE